MKFGQLIDLATEMFFFKNHAQNETERLVSGYFLFFIKALCKVKRSGLELGFTIF